MSDNDAIAEANLEAYRQANEIVRHFSGLRFTVLGAFVAISGGLYVLAIENLTRHPPLIALAAFTTIVATAFAAFEWRLNCVAEFYAKKIHELAVELKMSPTACGYPQKTWLKRWFAPLLMFVIYAGSTVMWVYACINWSQVVSSP